MIVNLDIKEIDMVRNLDLTALRSFVAVAEEGGVTRAAGHLHLTQSAVSMQLKRLEEAMGQSLLDRSSRTIALTAQGELLLSYGRRLLALNDEVWARMTDQTYEGEVILGVPHDIIYPHIPGILKRFAAEYPRIKVQLQSLFTSELKRQFRAGEADVILTTEENGEADCELLARLPLVWFGAINGQAWKARPVRLAYEKMCIFKGKAQRALDDHGVSWEMGVDTTSSRTVEASLSADLAVHACLQGTEPAHWEEVPHGGALPDLPAFEINMYVAPKAASPFAAVLAEFVRNAYR